MPVRTTSQIDRVRAARKRLLRAQREQAELRTRSGGRSGGGGGGAPPASPRSTPPPLPAGVAAPAAAPARKAEAAAEKRSYAQLVQLKQQLGTAMSASSLTLERIFRGFDTNGDGMIDLMELNDGLSTLGLDIPGQLVVDIFTLLDKDGGGDVEYMEFARWFGAGPPPAPLTPEVRSRQKARAAMSYDMASHLVAIEEAARKRQYDRHESNTQLLARVFNQLDTDDSGTLTSVEIKRALKCMGISGASVMAQEVMAELDVDGDKVINVLEFVSGLPPPAVALIKSQLNDEGLIDGFVDDGRDRKKDVQSFATADSSVVAMQKMSEQCSAEKRSFAQLYELKQQLGTAMSLSKISLERTFRGFDTNGDGMIDLAELKQGLAVLGVTVPEQLVVDMFTLLDKDGGGDVEYMEFARWFGAGPPPAPLTPEVAMRQRARAASGYDMSDHLAAIEEAARKRATSDARGSTSSAKRGGGAAPDAATVVADALESMTSGMEELQRELMQFSQALLAPQNQANLPTVFAGC